MQDDGIVLLTCSGKESGNIDERHDGNVECVAEADEASALAAAVAIEHACKLLGLVGNDADALTVEAGKADDDVLCEVRLNLEELAVIDDAGNYLIHVVRHVRIVGNDVVQVVLHAVDGVGTGYARCLLEVVLRNIREELLNHSDTLFLRLGREVCHTTLRSMNACATQLFLSNNFAQNCLHGTRTCKEHVAASLHHEGEVGQGRTIDSTACAGTHDGANLRNNA